MIVRIEKEKSRCHPGAMVIAQLADWVRSKEGLLF